MKYIFFGTPEFAAIILEKLIKAGLVPEAVICNPNRPIGRKQIITSPPTKVLAEKYKIQTIQPETLANSKFHFRQKRIPGGSIPNSEFDLFIVAAYSKIFPKEILEIPKLGVIGVHPSLLPKHRGPTPIQTAILNGDKETGVSLFLIDEEVDHGEIIARRKFSIFNLDPPGICREQIQFSILSQKLAELGANLLIEILPKYINAEITPLPQDESQATYTKKFSTQDGRIEPNDLEKAENEGGEIALGIDRKIRALNPEPGTWTIKNGKRMKILEAEIIGDQLKLKKIQFESKKPIQL